MHPVQNTWKQFSSSIISPGFVKHIKHSLFFGISKFQCKMADKITHCPECGKSLYGGDQHLDITSEEGPEVINEKTEDPVSITYCNTSRI